MQQEPLPTSPGGFALVRQLIEWPENEEWSLPEEEPPFFFVDWREEDASIAEYCSNAAGHECVVSDWRGDDLYVVSDRLSRRVPLTSSVEDRHITLLTINEVIAPHHEIRYVWASHGADTAALVVLTPSEWQSLIQRYGESAVNRAFPRLQERPNIFTDSLRPPRRKWWRFWE